MTLSEDSSSVHDKGDINTTTTPHNDTSVLWRSNHSYYLHTIKIIGFYLLHKQVIHFSFIYSAMTAVQQLMSTDVKLLLDQLDPLVGVAGSIRSTHEVERIIT